jgi:hypothetical protein
MLVLPPKVDLDELAEREKKRGLLGGEKIVWKKVTWWPCLDCVLNMEPYHDNRRVTVAKCNYLDMNLGSYEGRLARGVAVSQDDLGNRDHGSTGNFNPSICGNCTASTGT